MERLKAEIASTTNVVQEGYELKFLGKSYAKLLASTETTTVIQPNEAHNSLPENANSENIYISGDNLDGLKHLLKSYNGAIKCIYIDPPYNTGSDGFVYADNFNYTKDALQEKLSVSEEEAERILDLTKRGSASHSAWLMFMYSRLLLARDLLKDDGVIFISIDDNEQANLKLLCDDVFGEENWLGTIVWKNATDNNPTQIAIEHEYVLCFAKQKSLLESEWKSKLSDIKDLLIEKGNELNTRFTNLDELKNQYSKWYKAHKNELWPLDRYKYIDEGGIYTGSQSVHNPGKEGYRYDVIHPITNKPCKQPLMGYRFPETTMKELIENDKILFGDDETKIIELKLYAKEFSEKLSSVIDFDGRIGSYDLKELFPETKTIFTNPKPVNFISQFISFVLSNNEDILLDFFSGSGSSAHALMDINSKDSISRRFIAIQIPAAFDLSIAPQKAAHEFLKENNLPTTLDYIGIERIKRAAVKIKEEHPDKELDLGFKHYILQEPNQNTLDKLDSFNKASLLADTTIMEEFGKPTILATWLNADGYGLTVQATAINLAGYTAYYCQKHLYLIDPGFTLESMKALLSKYDAEGHFNPENMVLFGYSFPDWSINEMIEKNLRILNDGEKNLKINFTVRY
ncbi:MAG: site-specific DNA-methyltransferase [Chitinophagaceae bacterium]|nr:site-specific DNA-methyltransferase [Chitinophagaceae bacterium]